MTLLLKKIFFTQGEAERIWIFRVSLKTLCLRHIYVGWESSFPANIPCGKVWNNAFKLKRKRKVLMTNFYRKFNNIFLYPQNTFLFLKSFHIFLTRKWVSLDYQWWVKALYGGGQDESLCSCSTRQQIQDSLHSQWQKHSTVCSLGFIRNFSFNQYTKPSLCLLLKQITKQRLQKYSLTLDLR